MHTLLNATMDGNYYPNTNSAFGSRDSSPSTYVQETNFEVSDFLEFNNWVEDEMVHSSFPACYNNPDSFPQNMNYTVNDVVVSSGGTESNSFQKEGTNRNSGSGKAKKAIREKVAFKTKSEVEILDDGFKWRKYGKKMVKNSKNPRNYYRCSAEGCPVKKRVERDNDDARYVVTTYEGVHNHQSPTL